jgi:peptide-methionine (R)-S-oxide reductase
MELDMILTKRALLGGAGLTVLALALPGLFHDNEAAVAAGYATQLTPAQWKAKLTPQQYAVLREQATERAFTSPLDTERRAGTFLCAGCDQKLFSSRTKYDSGTGWPSFWKPLAGAVRTSNDRSLGETRTEVHCARCGGHLGHVFDDGPPPTGLRYCMNGVAMRFVPAG